MPRTFTLSALFTSTLLLSACAEPLIDASSPATPPTITAAQGGWTTISVPGWIHVDFPTAPKTVEHWDRTHQGRYQYKELVTESGEGYVALRYVEFRDPKDIAEAKAALPNKWNTLPPGVHSDAIEPLSLSGAEGAKAHFHVDAHSSTNGAPFPLAEQAVWIMKGERFYWMDCATPVDKAANCDRVLASFTIEPSAH